MAFIVSPKQLRDRAELYHQLALLVASGIPIIQALEMQRRKPLNRASGKAMENVTAMLKEGSTVTEAIRVAGDFPEFDSALIEAGDRSGRLDQCFKLLSAYYEERAQNLRTVLGGLAYPIFLLHFAAFIFPFIEWFRTSNTLKFVLEVGAILVPLYVLTGLIIYACQGRHGEKWRSMIEKIVHPIPLIGTARRQLALARLSAALEALLNAGVGIIGAWELAAASSGSPFLRRTVYSWKQDLENGSTPAELVHSSRAFPDPFVNLYQTGETTGQLDETLKRLHAMYREDGSRNLLLASKLFPKIVYGIIAAYVAWKVISFYVGYFNQINDAMKPLHN